MTDHLAAPKGQTGPGPATPKGPRLLDDAALDGVSGGKVSIDVGPDLRWDPVTNQLVSTPRP